MDLQVTFLHVFEIILREFYKSYSGVGFSETEAPLNRLPGWDKSSYGYHGDDGMIRAAGSTETYGSTFTTGTIWAAGSIKTYGPTFTTGDVIGCCFNLVEMQIFFTKNGKKLDVTIKGINSTTLYPTLGMLSPGEIVQANFGQSEFIFDFEKYLHDRR